MQERDAATPEPMARSRAYRSPRRDGGVPGDGVSLEQLLRAGRVIFTRAGYHAATVDDICHEAGISRGTFYFYFRDKRHLFVHLMTAAGNEFTQLARRQYPGKDAYSRIVAANAAYLYWMEGAAPLLAQMLALALSDAEILRQYESSRRRVEERIRRRLMTLLDAGEIPETDPALLASVLTGMVESFSIRYFAVDSPVGVRHVRFAQALRALSEAWYCAIYAKPPPDGFVYEEYVPEGMRDAAP
jgi:AcrR family transcriptional regulator